MDKDEPQIKKTRNEKKRERQKERYCNDSEYKKHVLENGKKWRKIPKNARKRRLYQAKQQRNKTKRNRMWVWQYKMKHPCHICGESNPACLDFHHIDPDTKILKITKACHLSIKRIIAEIGKCEILCANCHRKLHAGELLS